MRTYLCCADCRVRCHLIYKIGSRMRDDHPHACILCPPDGRGRQLTDDTTARTA